MTEQEWLISQDPLPMVDYLISQGVDNMVLVRYCMACEKKDSDWQSWGRNYRSYEKNKTGHTSAIQGARFLSGYEEGKFYVSHVKKRRHSDVLRDVAGNPFHPIPVISSWPYQWQAWKGGAIHNLAREIFHYERFEDFPILADMLEETGCTSMEILSHLREEFHTEHCWVLNLILGDTTSSYHEIKGESS